MNKPLKPEEEFMRSAAVLAFAIMGEGAVAEVRTLAGVTNPEKSIRAPSASVLARI